MVIIYSPPEFTWLSVQLMARNALIVSTARYLPEQAVTNAELTARFKALGKPTVIDRLAAGDWYYACSVFTFPTTG